jgi:hypothetical protein
LRSAGLLDTVITPSICRTWESCCSGSRVLGLHRLFTVLPHLVREPPGGDIFYKARLEGPGQDVSVLLMAGHFGIPFFYLMGPPRQAEGSDLAIAGGVAPRDALRDLYWQGHADASIPKAFVCRSGRGGVCLHRRRLRAAAASCYRRSGAVARTRPETRRVAGVENA